MKVHLNILVLVFEMRRTVLIIYVSLCFFVMCFCTYEEEPKVAVDEVVFMSVLRVQCSPFIKKKYSREKNRFFA
jgi:hypothetical protein